MFWTPPSVSLQTVSWRDGERRACEPSEGRRALYDASSRVLSEADHHRRRVARDLHDGLQVSLVRLSMQAHRLAQETCTDASRALAAQLAVEVDEAASTLRAIVNGVMPAPLVERGLAAAVQELAYDLPVRTTLDVDGLPAGLPAPVESTAYFIAAEALTNVIKHADARSVDLSLRLEGARCPSTWWTTAAAVSGPTPPGRGCPACVTGWRSSAAP